MKSLKKQSSGGKIIFCKALNYEQVRNLFVKTIVSFKPDFVFVGLTETLSRVDHIARDICLKQKIKCGALQDYWGYLGNFNKFNYPDYFYVFDDEALKLSALNSEGSINCLAVGSPKHEAYKYNIKNGQNVVC